MKIAKLGDKFQNARLRWCRRMKRREGYVGKRMMEMAVLVRKKRGRPRRRWMDLAREDMDRVGAKEGDKVDQDQWILLLCWVTSNKGKPKEEEAPIKHYMRLLILN